MLMFDESGLVKKGTDSVGVARQYCGSLGKVEHCQVVVCAAYASRQGYALVDKRLFMPEAWFTEDYKERWDKCQVPEDVTLHTKPPLAAAMFWKYFCLTKNDAAFHRVFQYCSVAEPCRLLVPDLVESAMLSPMECPTEASKLVVSILYSAI